jgi:hypothetical protein
VLRTDLARQLGVAGLPPEVASQVVELLEACNQLRFGDADNARAEALLADVEALVRGLVRRAPAARRSGDEARA